MGLWSWDWNFVGRGSGAKAPRRARAPCKSLFWDVSGGPLDDTVFLFKEALGEIRLPRLL